MFGHTIFFGMYHPGDYVRLLLHRGRRTVFWCGSDILNLKQRLYWLPIIRSIDAEHICENAVEFAMLSTMGIYATILPSLFESPENIEVCYKQSDTPHVYLCVHPGREEEYGINFLEKFVFLVPEVIFHIYGTEGISHENIVYHGIVPNWQFNLEIKEYQAALRLNEFDGFSEVLAKSVLMGQYPISYIPYPHIDCARTIGEFKDLLCQLNQKIKPNLEAMAWWKAKLEDSLAATLA